MERFHRVNGSINLGAAESEYAARTSWKKWAGLFLMLSGSGEGVSESESVGERISQESMVTYTGT